MALNSEGHPSKPAQRQQVSRASQLSQIGPSASRGPIWLRFVRLISRVTASLEGTFRMPGRTTEHESYGGAARTIT